MTELTVTYGVFDDELEAINELAKKSGRTIKQQFELMMTVGSMYDIKNKIEFWRELLKKQNLEVKYDNN